MRSGNKIAFKGGEWEPVINPVYAKVDSRGRFYVGTRYAGRVFTAFVAHPNRGDERFSLVPIDPPVCDLLELVKLAVAVSTARCHDDYAKDFWEGEFKAGGFGGPTETDAIIFDIMVDLLDVSEVRNARTIEELLPDVRDPDAQKKLKEELTTRLTKFALKDEELILDYEKDYDKDAEARIGYLAAMVAGLHVDALANLERELGGPERRRRPFKI